MVKNSKYKSISEMIAHYREEHPSKYWDIFMNFLTSYEAILKKKQLNVEKQRAILICYGDLILAHLKHPPKFECYHKAIRSPIDCYQVGLEFFRPLVDFTHSTLKGKEHLKQMEEQLARGENVVLYANHQTEADPQVISLLLEKDFSKLAEEMIYVAGERVVTDALAVPFSLGRHLFCVYSKKYFDAHPDRKVQMLEHNKKTIFIMGQHMKEGGKCIIIFPSGGRDRPNIDGVVEVAAFDPQSVELLHLLGRKCGKPTHFYPLALSTHDILPPPQGLQINLGEERRNNEAPIHIAFGQEIHMENFPKSDTTDKEQKRIARAGYVWKLVCEMYNQFPS